MKAPPYLLLLFLALEVPLSAGPRISASYGIASDTVDAGGNRTTSASYNNDGSLGGVAGISIVASPAETAKSGYVGQLYEITGLTLTAASPDVNEGTTDQIAAWQALDDATLLAVSATAVAWSVASGPLTGISAGGLATADIVYQESAATVQGTYLGDTGILGLTVKNVNLDNFGSYATDGLDDAWQNQYFGLNNPLAVPLLDPDGDGQTNAFEFTAGLVPTNPLSLFRLRIEAVAGEPGQKNLIFSPHFNDRTYTVISSADLAAGPWLPLGSSTFSDNVPLQQRTVTDLDATGSRKFYQVEILKP